MSQIITNTPLEEYRVDNRVIMVKREDLCIDGPSFSKLRGVSAHLAVRPEGVIGVLDTFHSKAGWGVSLLGKGYGKKVVVYYPVYKSDRCIRGNQIQARKCGAELRGFTAGRSCILYHRAKKDLLERYPGAYMMPNALKLEESVDATAAEVWTVPKAYFKDTIWVVSVSSGTIAAGVVRGLIQQHAHVSVWLHEGYSRPSTALVGYVTKYNPDLLASRVNLRVVDEGYSYADAVKYPAPFPCNPFYDLKAWRWTCETLLKREVGKILFWNIGA